MKNIRVKSSLLEMIIVFVFNILAMIFGIFRMRDLLVYYGADLNGFYQLIAQVVSYLTIAELGLTQAFNISMYRSVAKKDQTKTYSLYLGCTYFQNIIVIVMIVIGLFLFGFLLTYQNVMQISVIIIGFLCLSLPIILQQRLSARFIVYNAYQEKYKYEFINQLMITLKVIISLFIIRNLPFVWFLTIEFLENIVIYFILRMYTNKKIKEIKCEAEKDLSPLEMSKSLIGIRVANTLINSTDNIIVSKAVSLASLSVYTTYKYIINLILHLIMQIVYSSRNAFGNYFACNDGDRTIFAEMFVATVGFFAALISTLSVLGINQMVLLISNGANYNYSITLINKCILGLWLFVKIYLLSFDIFVDAIGLYKETVRYKLLESVLTLVLGIVFVYTWGMYGVMLASIICRLFIYFPAIIKAYYQEKYIAKLKFYFKDVCLIIFCCVMIIYFQEYALVSLLKWNSLINWIISMIVLGIISLVTLFFSYIFINKNFRNLIILFINKWRNKYEKNNI